MDIELREVGELPELKDEAREEIAYYTGGDAIVDGNDLLYYCCRMRPFHEMAAVKRDAADEELDVRALADQLWLIGRAYAASPERYRYSAKKSDKSEKGKPSAVKGRKPKETYLDSEGYESFFRDVARMMLNARRGDLETPLMCFRGELFKREAIEGLTCLDGEGRRKLAEVAGRASRALGYDIRTLRTGIVALRGEDRPGLIKQIKSGEQVYRLNPDWEERIEKISEMVVLLADALRQARTLRDIAIVIRTMRDGADENKREKRSVVVPAWLEALTYQEQTLNISFASKFLHFHYPKLFFIFDSISEARARLVAEVICGAKPSHSEQVEVRIDGWPDGLASPDQERRREKLIEKLTEYRKHVARELAIAYALSGGNESDGNKGVYGLFDLGNLGKSDVRTASSEGEFGSNGGIFHRAPFTRLIDMAVTNNGVQFKGKLAATLLSDSEA